MSWGLRESWTLASYLDNGGYEGLRRALAMTPEEVHQAVSPVFTSTAVSRPQGGAQHGQPLAEKEKAENEIAAWAALGLVL